MGLLPFSDIDRRRSGCSPGSSRATTTDFLRGRTSVFLIPRPGGQPESGPVLLLRFPRRRSRRPRDVPEPVPTRQPHRVHRVRQPDFPEDLNRCHPGAVTSNDVRDNSHLNPRDKASSHPSIWLLLLSTLNLCLPRTLILKPTSLLSAGGSRYS